MIAKRQLGTLAFKGRRVDVSREGDLWVVRLDPDLRDKSKVYASVEIDAATGEVTGGKHDIYQVEIVKP